MARRTEGGAYNEDTTDVVFGPVNKQRWIYATAKLLLDRVLYAHGVAGNLDYTIIRPFNFIGSRIDYLVAPGTMGGPRVFAHFLSALMGNGPMYLGRRRTRAPRLPAHRRRHGGMQLILDRAGGDPEPDLQRRQPGQQRHHPRAGGPHDGLSTRKSPASSQEPPLVEVSGEEFYGAGYEDSDRLPPDISKIGGLGWTPRHDLEKTLRDAMGYYFEPGYEERRQVSLEPPLSQQIGLESPLPRSVEAGLVI